MLCLLSGKYPFFRCADDMTAMAQIMTVFGKKRVMESTKHLGKSAHFVCNRARTTTGYFGTCNCVCAPWLCIKKWELPSASIKL